MLTDDQICKLAYEHLREISNAMEHSAHPALDELFIWLYKKGAQHYFEELLGIPSYLSDLTHQ